MPQLDVMPQLGPPQTVARVQPKPRRRITEAELLAAKLERAIRRAIGEKVRDLKVEYHDDRIVIFGRCGTFYCKQQVQQAALALMKDQPDLAREELVNRIRVW